MVELARQLRHRGLARPEMGRGVRRRRGGVPETRIRRQGMSETATAGCGGHTVLSDAGVAPSLGVVEGLGFAATPSFALMAVLTVAHQSSPADILCSAAHDASPLGGMLPMYVLMGAFHSAPWLKLISRRKGIDRRWCL